MTITARFSSVCPACSQKIQPGQPVEWARGQKARHAACDIAGTTPIVASQPATRINVTYETAGARVYVLGDTFKIRGAIKDVGGHWDDERKAWWIGATKRETLAAAIASAKPDATPYKPREQRRTSCLECGGPLDRFQQQRGFTFCSRECATERKMGSGWSGYVGGSWHQGSDD